MKLDDVREAYLKFYESKGHTRWASDSLIPGNDPTLLFTGAGMNQFKDMFLGKGNLPFKRATTAQKCIRTGDIEKVGKTAAHHTFFEMMGNFSFGDYFKKDAIHWAWEFLTEVLKISQDKLLVSVYEEDEEAFEIWSKQIKINENRIFKFGASDNFWPANAPEEGPNGPCGPCSEIFFDLGEEESCGSPDCNPSCSCNRFVEIWNLVFTQFNRQDGGALDPLPQKNIDTGLGLERMTAMLIGAKSNFEIDIFTPIIKAEEDILKQKYVFNSEFGSRMRRIADHIRAITFMIADGVLPSNEGRGYVERRLIRRAMEDGFAMNTFNEFLYTLIPVVTEVMKTGYPELTERMDNILRIVKNEETNFLNVYENGKIIIERKINEIRSSSLTDKSKLVFPGEELFKLHDTFGLSIYSSSAIVSELAPEIKIDKIGFEREMQKQKKQSRASSKISNEIFGKDPLLELKVSVPRTTFLGYKKIKAKSKILAILKDDKFTDSANEKDKVFIVFDKTPFYAESGGQVGDSGMLIGKDLKADVITTKKYDDYHIHYCKIDKGNLNVNDEIKAIVDLDTRLDIQRNHTATHLLQAALRQVFGKHIEQAGSFVDYDRLRFDFTHFSQLTTNELNVIEHIVNERILDDTSVRSLEMSYDEAKAIGALAFFGEKYGDQVRMINIGDYSKELCGGTHVSRTGQIGTFIIASEKSIGSNIRRIEALTGRAALKYIQDERKTMGWLTEYFGVKSVNIPQKVRELVDKIKDMQGENVKKQKQNLSKIADEAVENKKEINNFKIGALNLKNINPNDLRILSDKTVKPNKLDLLFVVTTNKDKLNILLSFGKEFIAKTKLDARDVIKDISSSFGGKGGGKSNMAMAGGKGDSKLVETKFWDVVGNLFENE